MYDDRHGSSWVVLPRQCIIPAAGDVFAGRLALVCKQDHAEAHVYTHIYSAPVRLLRGPIQIELCSDFMLCAVTNSQIYSYCGDINTRIDTQIHT